MLLALGSAAVLTGSELPLSVMGAVAAVFNFAVPSVAFWTIFGLFGASTLSICPWIGSGFGLEVGSDVSAI